MGDYCNNSKDILCYKYFLKTIKKDNPTEKQAKLGIPNKPILKMLSH